MKSRPISVTEKSLTGQSIELVPINKMKQRVHAIKYRNSHNYGNSRQQVTTLNIHEFNQKHLVDEQSDKATTNFWPVKPPITRFNSITTKKKKIQENDRSLTKFDINEIRARTASMQQKRFRLIRPQSTIPTKKQQKRKSTVDASTYEKQLCYFRQLYDHLGAVLSSIQTGTEDLQKAISDYGKYIRNKHISFIDDFLENKQYKIKKQIRMCRIYEFLSIAYLFLEIAQDRLENNQSYLVNFIGFCLSNLIYLARTYILLQKRTDFQCHVFEKQVQNFQMASYGQILRNLDDVILRIQHNNEIITMIHKKLGRQNQKFQNCIRLFLKNAQRKKHSTCLCGHYIFQYLAMHIHQSQLVGLSSFLQIAPTPYLAPQQQHQYTLVIQPIGILKSGDKLRPYLSQFLKWASKYFDIVLWTWEMPSQIEDFMALVDPYLFSKLYRYHCQIKNEIFTKDLSRLGRNLEKTVIIDYDQRIFSQNIKNGFVCRWKGGKKDRALLVICQIFQQMVTTGSSVQQMLTFYAEQINSVKGH